MANSATGEMALAVMWSLTAVTLVFLTLRLITRYYIIDQLGSDDYVYCFAAVLLILYTSFTHVAEIYGFGRPIHTLDIEDATLAIKYEMLGQTFSIIGMAVSKVSLGLFLLRLTIVKWHRIAIWIVMGSLMTDSVVTVITFWLQCKPPRAIFDLKLRPLPDTDCTMDITPVAVTLGVFCVVSDFFFAAFPTLIVWNLNMKRKEKIFIAAAFGLGVLAGAAGIVRTYEVANGFTENYTEDTVPLIVWSCVEQAVTMICIGIPLLRPLFRRVIKGTASSESRKYQKQGEGSDRQAYELSDTISKRKKSARDHDLSGNDTRLGIKTQTITKIGTSGINDSDEHILAGEGANREASDGGEASGPANGQQPPNGGIHVQEDVTVEWKSRR